MLSEQEQIELRKLLHKVDTDMGVLEVVVCLGLERVHRIILREVQDYLRPPNVTSFYK